MKKDAILFGPHCGELFWEFLRFSPVLPYKYRIYKDSVKYIVMTRFDRFDLYGQFADIFVPLRVCENNLTQDCHRLTGFPNSEYQKLIQKFRDKYKTRYNIIEHIYPNLQGRNFVNRNLFPSNKMIYKWRPRLANKQIIDNYIPNDRPLICLAPRFRLGVKRNWPHWLKFYDLIFKSKDLYEKFYFVLCGKSPDYIEDPNKRFFDVNTISLSQDVSTIGLTFECLKRSVLTVGSQSGIPNISMILGTPVLEWGHQRHLHTKTYNITKSPVCFLDDMKYNIAPETVIEHMKKILKVKT